MIIQKMIIKYHKNYDLNLKLNGLFLFVKQQLKKIEKIFILNILILKEKIYLFSLKINLYFIFAK